jgi:S-adenosylmethionine:tRNA ribosyltransferase-isomerase
LKTDTFDYHLPPELIAQEPVEPRDASRLLVLGSRVPAAGRAALEHRTFRDLPDCLEPGDLVVFNETKVIPARLLGWKTSGGRVEVLLLRPVEGSPEAADDVRGDVVRWEALVKPGRRVRPGSELVFGEDPGAPLLRARVEARTEAGGRLLSFTILRGGESFGRVLEELGRVPLPPYVTRALEDPERYQTIYARRPGSVAAPTAGLHFTPEVMRRLSDKGVSRAWVTLHIGLDTFRPVREENVEDHRMHREWYDVPAETAEAIARCRRRGGAVVACGTTVVRTLESAADPDRPGLVRPGSGETSLFIYPGFRFRVVDALLTNFHLPRSTLIMLVAAFGGTERVMAAYREAVRVRYRFYSFGDAMLVFPPSGPDRAGTGRPPEKEGRPL